MFSIDCETKHISKVFISHYKNFSMRANILKIKNLGVEIIATKVNDKLTPEKMQIQLSIICILPMQLFIFFAR